MTDPITADLVNALRYQLRYHPEHTVGMCSDALEAFDAAKNAPDAVPLDLQPLHDLVAKWAVAANYEQRAVSFSLSVCARELEKAQAKLQSAGAVK